MLTIFVISIACSSNAVLSKTEKGLTTPRTTPTTLPTTLIDGVVLVVSADVALNLRNIPDAAGPVESRVIARMKDGEGVTWLEKCQGGWAKVKYGRLIGWALSYRLNPRVCQ